MEPSSALCASKRAIILLCVADKGQTVDQIFTKENTHTIISDLMGLTSPPTAPPPHPKKSAKCSRLELTTATGGHLGGVGQHGPLIRPLEKDGAGNDVHFALSTEQQGYD